MGTAMKWKNTADDYGLISIMLHWLSAILIIGLFALGQYMTELDYYDRWYHKAPDVHRSLGILFGGMLILRIAWRLSTPRPVLYGKSWERSLGKLVHRLFYVLMIAIVISGYLISTAKGDPISVFGWFKIPALFHSGKNLQDTAGEIHELLSNLTIFLAVLHTSAALRHHFVDKDPTLTRMLGLYHPDARSLTHPPKENQV